MDISTARVEENEIAKSVDFEYGFQSIIRNTALLDRIIMSGSADYVIGGNVTVGENFTLIVAPLWANGKDVDLPAYSNAEIILPMSMPNNTQPRIDIIEVCGAFEDYDEEQRAFYDSEVNTHIYHDTNTKRRLVARIQIKQGAIGSNTAPETTYRWIKLAEVFIAGDGSFEVANITARAGALDNVAWTSEKRRTFSPLHLPEIGTRFLKEHEENGVHKKIQIDAGTAKEAQLSTDSYSVKTILQRLIDNIAKLFVDVKDASIITTGKLNEARLDNIATNTPSAEATPLTGASHTIGAIVQKFRNNIAQLFINDSKRHDKIMDLEDEVEKIPTNDPKTGVGIKITRKENGKRVTKNTTYSPPKIRFKETNHRKFMRGFMRPASREVFRFIYEKGMEHRGATHSSGGAFFGGVLAPNGKVVFVPYVSTLRLSYNYNYKNELSIKEELVPNPPPLNYSGGVLAPNGDVIFVPYNNASKKIGVFNPFTNQFNEIETFEAVSFAFSSGVLLPDGRILFVPANNSHFGIYKWWGGESHKYEQTAYFESNTTMKFRGAVLAPCNNKVVLVPFNNDRIGIYNIQNDTYSACVLHGKGAGAFSGGVLLPDGKVLLVPYNSDTIGIYDPYAKVPQKKYTDGAVHNEGADAFSGGVLLPNGKVLLVPFNSDRIGIYDPQSNRYTRGPAHNAGGKAFSGGVLVPDGKVVLVPHMSAHVGIVHLTGLDIGLGYCLHPYLNKF